MSSDHIKLRRKRAEYAASHAATPSDIKLRDDEIEKIDRAIQPACTEAEQASQLLAAYKVELQDVEGAIKQAKDAHTIERAKKRADAIRAEIDTLEKAALMGEAGNAKGLDVFKGKHLTASDVTVRLLRKDENSQPDRVEISAPDVTRTVFCTDLGLIDKRNGLLNRAGSMLLALSKSTPALNIKAPGQAMKELRKIFRGIGIMDKDPFHPKGMDWQPRFKLLDAIVEADKRKAQEAVHVQYDERLGYDQKDDEAGKWLGKRDN